MCVFTRGRVRLFGVSILSLTSATESIELLFPFRFEKAFLVSWAWVPGQQFTRSQERLGPSTCQHHDAMQSQANSALYGLSSSLQKRLKTEPTLSI